MISNPSELMSSCWPTAEEAVLTNNARTLSLAKLTDCTWQGRKAADLASDSVTENPSSSRLVSAESRPVFNKAPDAGNAPI